MITTDDDPMEAGGETSGETTAHHPTTSGPPLEQVPPTESQLTGNLAGTPIMPTDAPAIQPSSSTAPTPSTTVQQPPTRPQKTDIPEDPYVKPVEQTPSLVKKGAQAMLESRPEAIHQPTKQPTAPQRRIIIVKHPTAQSQKPNTVGKATAPSQSPIMVRKAAAAQPQKPITVLKSTAPTGSPITVRKPTTAAPPMPVTTAGQATSQSKKIIAVNQPSGPKPTVQQPIVPPQRVVVVNKNPTAPPSRKVIVARRSGAVQKKSGAPNQAAITAQQPTVPVRKIIVVKKPGAVQKSAAAPTTPTTNTVESSSTDPAQQMIQQQSSAAPARTNIVVAPQPTAPTQPVVIAASSTAPAQELIIQQIPAAAAQKLDPAKHSTAQTQPVFDQSSAGPAAQVPIQQPTAPVQKLETDKHPAAQSQKPIVSIAQKPTTAEQPTTAQPQKSIMKHHSASAQKATPNSSNNKTVSIHTTAPTQTVQKPTTTVKKAPTVVAASMKKPSPIVPAVLTDTNTITYTIVRRTTLRPLYTGPPPKCILKRKPGDIFPVPDGPLLQDVRFSSERARSIRSPSRRAYQRWRELRRSSADYCSSSDSDSDATTSSDSSDESDVEMEQEGRSEVHPNETTASADPISVKEVREESGALEQAAHQLLHAKDPTADSSPDADSPDAPSAGTSTAVASGPLVASTASTSVSSQPTIARNSEDSDEEEEEDNEEEAARKHTALIAAFEAMYKRRRGESEWRWKTLPDPSTRPPSKSPLTQALALACRNALANNAQRPPPLVVQAKPIRPQAATPTPISTPAPAAAHVRPVAAAVISQRQAPPTPATHPLHVSATPSLHSPGAAPSPQQAPTPSTATHHSTAAALPSAPRAPTEPKAAQKRRRARRSRSPSPSNSRSCSPDLAAEISRRGLFPMDRRKMISMQQTPAVKPGTGILRTVARTADYAEDENATHVRCNLCQQWFAKANKPKIRYHVLFHCPMKGFQCKHCNYAHHELGKIKRHHKNVHHMPKEEPHKFENDLINAAYDVYMKKCFPNFDTGKLSIGRSINYPTSLDVLSKCMVCKKRVYNCLTTYHVVDKHINTKMYPCSLHGCKYKTINKRELVIHRQACHNDNSMTIFATRIDFTDTTKFTIKSFFPELNDVNCEKAEPELKRMAEAAAPGFNKDHELRPLLAAQDGLSHVLNEPLEKPAECVKCEKRRKEMATEMGSVAIFHNVYDLVLHTKSHIGGDQQWSCPERLCKYSSRYKIDVDMHCFNHHPRNNYQAVNRWHESLPGMTSTYRMCFPEVSTPWPVSSILIDHRSVFMPAHIGALIKADVSETAAEEEQQPPNLSEEDEWSDGAPMQQDVAEEEEINIVD